MTRDAIPSRAAKTFPTLDVVGAATGILLGDIGGIYKVLDHVLGDKLFTHQLPAASRAAQSHIEAQHPWISDLEPRRDSPEALQAWCRLVVNAHGERIPLTPAVDADWATDNALRDLEDVADGRPVIAVPPGRFEDTA